MAVDFINQNYQKDISLDIIAHELHFSAGYIGLLFKQAMGMSFVDYLHKVRIGKACEILKDYRLKTYEVSNQVGYFDEKYFTQIFKKITGLTFTQYRDSL
jgi:two-component system response regulator YesN